MRTAEITEAWQETGQDYVTVHFLASLLDYTTDESGARVLDGSRTEPVKFEEYWTFVRPVGPGRSASARSSRPRRRRPIRGHLLVGALGQGAQRTGVRLAPDLRAPPRS